MDERITINELIEKLNKLPEERKKLRISAIGTYSDNGKRFYKFHVGSVVNPIYIDIPIN